MGGPHFSAENLQYLHVKRGKVRPRLLLMANEVEYALSIGAKIDDLG